MKTLIERLFGSTQERTEKEAKDKFQIEEFEGEIWLTCDNTLVCPTKMFCSAPIDALKEIRRLYVKRTAIEED